MVHEIGAPAFLPVRLLGDLTGHDDNRSLAECDTIACLNIFLQHRSNDAECIGASEVVRGIGESERQWQRAERMRGQGQLKHEGKRGFISQGRGESETGQKG